MARLLLNLKDIHLTFGGKPVLEGADLTLAEGERITLVGRNGTGKSTLLKIAAGLVEPDQGEQFLQPGTTLRYLPQEPDLAGYASVSAYVEEELGPTDNPYQARLLLEALGLSGAEEPMRLSGGEARRAAIARALASDPDILLLDEPTNHLDLPAIEWLEQTLAQSRAAMVLISHDRRFLDSLSNAVVWLDRGQSRRMNRGFSHFEEWRDQVIEEEEREQSLLSKRIATEEHWMRYGVTARRKRNMRRVALLADLRKGRKEHVGRLGTVNMQASAGEMSGKLVVEARKVCKSFADRKIVADLDLLLLRGDRLAIVGPNGAGKTTLIRLLTGALEPDDGSVRHGTNLQVVALDQNRQSLRPDDLLADVITGGRGNSVTINGETRHVMTYMQDFLFRPEQARTPVSVLSGGERARLILARELAKPSNFLVMDEPTNDLDLETLDLMQELLGDYAGTLLLVSHDRDFVDRIATSVLMHEGDGRWVEYAGGYSDMMAQRGSGIAAPAPKSVVRSPTPARADTMPAVKRKLSFREKHALETLPGRIATLAAELAQVETRLADAGLYARDPKAFAAATQRHQQVKAERTVCEEEWLAAELLREELEAGQV